MSDWIIFDNWPYETLDMLSRVKKRERLLILKAEYYGRNKTDLEKARSVGMSLKTYLFLKKKHGLLEDKNGHLRKPREEAEEWWGNEEFWYDN